jgi:hypothetical protein
LVAAIERAPERAASVLGRTMALPGGPAFLTEPLLNRVAYQLRPGPRAAAITVFEAIVARFPQSANAADGLAEALEASGDTTRAVTEARRALRLAASQAELPPATRQQLETINRQRLVRLGAEPR